MEDRIRADLALGRHQLVVGELTDLVDQHPLREGLSGAAGDRARTAVAARRRHCVPSTSSAPQLVDGLGVDPSKRIRELESADPRTGSGARIARTGAGGTAASAAPAVTTSTAQPVVAGDHLTDRIGAHFEGLTATELVGRQGEQQVLVDVLDAAARSITQWVVLEGEPGIGKTRLLEYLAHEATERGFTVMWGRSHESGSPPAFWPWLAALRGITDPGHPLPPPTQELLDRLLAPAGHDDFSPPVDASRFRLFEAIALLLQSSSSSSATDDRPRRPAVGRSRIARADRVPHRNHPRRPVLFAATCAGSRSDATTRSCTHSHRSRDVRSRDGWGSPGSTATRPPSWRGSRIGGEVSADVIAAINQRSEGNPFFIGELARLLASRGRPHPGRARPSRRGAGGCARRPPPPTRAATAGNGRADPDGGDDRTGDVDVAAEPRPGVPLDQCIDDLDAAFVTHLVVEASDTPARSGSRMLWSARSCSTTCRCCAARACISGSRTRWRWAVRRPTTLPRSSPTTSGRPCRWGSTNALRWPPNGSRGRTPPLRLRDGRHLPRAGPAVPPQPAATGRRPQRRARLDEPADRRPPRSLRLRACSPRQPDRARQAVRARHRARPLSPRRCCGRSGPEPRRRGLRDLGATHAEELSAARYSRRRTH